MNKLLSTVLVLALVAAGALARWWWPPLLGLAGARSSEIGGLASLVQLILWIVACAVLLVRPWRARNQGEAAQPAVTAQGRSQIATDGGVAGGQVAVGSVQGDMIVAMDPELLLAKIGQRRPAADLTQAAGSYLEYLVDYYRCFDLRGMGVSDRVPLRLPLLEMYVPLRARREAPAGETWERQPRVAGRPASPEELESLGERLGAPVPVLELLQKHDGLILLGDPGAGKTTFLKYLALMLATWSSPVSSSAAIGSPTPRFS